MRYVLPILLIFGFLGLYYFPNSDVRIAREPQQYYSLVQAIEKIPSDLKNPEIFNAKTAADYIEDLTRKAYRLRTQDIVPVTNEEKEHFKKKAQHLMENLFQTQLILRDKEKEFYDKGQISTKLVDHFRKAFTYLRYAQDYVAEEWNHFQSLNNSKKLFSGDYPLTLVNPEIGDLQFQSGDIILVRGYSFASASIARVTDVPSNMSHLAMVGEDEKGELVVVESLFETGVIRAPLEKFLKLEPLPRAAVYRHQDPAVAKKAGEAAYKISQQSQKKPIRFDITMNPNNREEMYCACLVRNAFKEAGVDLPTFWSSFERHQKKGPFLKNLGFKGVQTFAPADVDVEPSLILVAEHRDLKMLEISRMYDVILTVLFQRLEGEDQYKNSPRSYAKATTVHALRQLGFFSEKLPHHISTEVIQTLSQQRDIVEDMMSILRMKTKAARNLSYIEMTEIVEQEFEARKHIYFKSRKKVLAPSCRKLFL